MIAACEKCFSREARFIFRRGVPAEWLAGEESGIYIDKARKRLPIGSSKRK
jgi:hypothetical protein